MGSLIPRRLLGRAGVTAAALAAVAGGFAPPVLAGSAASGPVSSRPASGTPELVTTSGKGTENVRQLVQCGGMMYAVGKFTTIRQGGRTYTRNNIFSFKATAPYTVSDLKVGVNGVVDTITFSRHRGCADAYIGGSFTSVHGTSATNIAEVNTSTGAVVPTFGRYANGEVETLLGYYNHLLAGGKFTRTNGHGRYRYASLNPYSGKDDGFVRLRVSGKIPGTYPAQVRNQQLSHSGKLLLVEGDFTSVGGKARQQIFMLNLATTPASVTGWTSPEWDGSAGNLPGGYPYQCAPSEAFYVRAAAWSPDDKTVYLATTGRQPWNQPRGTTQRIGLCDAVSAFPATHTAVHHQWVEYSGCDSYYSVAADSSTVYAAGHPRWADNSNGCNHAGPGAVPDRGLQGLAASTGKVVVNARGTGLYTMSRANADTMLMTGAGLWIGSSNRFGSQYCGLRPDHAGICFLPRS